MHVDVVNKVNLWIILQRELIFRASVAEPWRIITTVHTRDPEKDLHMKAQVETAIGKREGDLKENRHLHFPHLVPREAECLPGGPAKVLKIHNNRILLQTEIRLAEVNTKMPVAPVVAIIPPVSTVSNLPVTVPWIEG